MATTAMDYENPSGDRFEGKPFDFPDFLIMCATRFVSFVRRDVTLYSPLLPLDISTSRHLNTSSTSTDIISSIL